MTRPNDIPDDIWDAARKALSLNFTVPIGGIKVCSAAARAILAERERCARIINAECARVLALQNGKDEAVDLNLRFVALLMPSLVAAVRKGGAWVTVADIPGEDSYIAHGQEHEPAALPADNNALTNIGIRICPRRDGPCPHGMSCAYWQVESWPTGSILATGLGLRLSHDPLSHPRPHRRSPLRVRYWRIVAVGFADSNKH
jgi:hypothetical protein